MSEKRFIFYEYDDGTETIEDTEENEYYHFSNELVGLLNNQQATIEQLRTQLAICQQSKNDDGRFQVWQVPPIKKGMRITTSTTSDGEKDE